MFDNEEKSAEQANTDKTDGTPMLSAAGALGYVGENEVAREEERGPASYQLALQSLDLELSAATSSFIQLAKRLSPVVKQSDTQKQPPQEGVSRGSGIANLIQERVNTARNLKEAIRSVNKSLDL